MLPPTSNRSGSSSGRPQMPTNQNKTRTTVLQEEKKRAATQRFLEQQEREQAKKATQVGPAMILTAHMLAFESRCVQVVKGGVFILRTMPYHLGINKKLLSISFLLLLVSHQELI